MVFHTHLGKIMNILNELAVYPDIQTLTLVNLFTGDEMIVTESQLIEAFGEDEVLKIKSNRNPAWMIIENV